MLHVNCTNLDQIQGKLLNVVKNNKYNNNNTFVRYSLHHCAIPYVICLRIIKHVGTAVLLTTATALEASSSSGVIEEK